MASQVPSFARLSYHPQTLAPYTTQCVGVDLSENMVDAYNNMAKNQVSIPQAPIDRPLGSSCLRGYFPAIASLAVPMFPCLAGRRLARRAACLLLARSRCFSLLTRG